MDLAIRKLNLIEKFMKVDSVEKLIKIERFFYDEIFSENNFTHELPEIAKQLLEKSKKDISDGNFRTHSEVMTEMKAKYKTS